MSEEDRRKGMVEALKVYIRTHQLKITVTDSVLVAGSEYCQFSGGRDLFFIESELASAVILVCDGESNDEVLHSWLVETKVQALPFEKITRQLKANMQVHSTTRFVELTTDRPSLAEEIDGLKTYGLVVGQGKPIYLISSYMDFRAKSLEYNIELQYNWGPLAATDLDRAFNCLIQKMTL